MCGFEGGDVNLLRYVHNNPTNATDPSGLKEAPKYEGEPTGGWKAVPGKSGAKAGAKGTFKWKLEKNPKSTFDSAIRAEFWFEPSKDNKAKKNTIMFIQIIQESTVGGKPWYQDDRPDVVKKWFGRFSTKPQLANGPDWVPFNESILAGPSPTSHRPPFLPWEDAEWYLGGGGATAYIDDIPTGKRKARKGQGDVIVRFETAAICVDSFEILGRLKWGFKIKDEKGSPVEILDGGPEAYGLEVTDDFKALVEKANSLDFIKFKIKEPDRTTINLGGTSALPSKKNQ
jgi:hypothetical protein